MQALQLTCACCGAPMRLVDPLHARCPYCGNEVIYREPKSDALTQALNRANEMRAQSRFADAILEYKLILKENPDDAEALWGLLLSEYGIEYVKDPRTGRYIPTCHRLSKTNILENKTYLRALENASETQRAEYSARAIQLDVLHKNILKRTQEAEDFDIFISFKSTDSNGQPTQDAQIARNIYDELTKRGFKVFFSDVTLSNMLFSDYEPIIFRALYSCKFFILVATQEEYIRAPWVKNEWSRFEERMQAERLSGVSCAVFDGGHVCDLPMFLRAQGVDLRRHSAGGYEVGIADAIERKLGKSTKSREEEAILRQIEEQKKAQKNLEDKLKNIQQMNVPVAGNGPTENSLLKRARQELVARNFEGAQEYYIRVLDLSPENGEAWWGLFLSAKKLDPQVFQTRKADTEDALIEELTGLANDQNYSRALEYRSEETDGEIEKFQEWMTTRKESVIEELQRTSQDAKQQFEDAEREEQSVTEQILEAKAEFENYVSAKVDFFYEMTAYQKQQKGKAKVWVVLLKVLVFLIMAGASFFFLSPYLPLKGIWSKIVAVIIGVAAYFFLGTFVNLVTRKEKKRRDRFDAFLQSFAETHKISGETVAALDLEYNVALSFSESAATAAAMRERETEMIKKFLPLQRPLQKALRKRRKLEAYFLHTKRSLEFLNCAQAIIDGGDLERVLTVINEMKTVQVQHEAIWKYIPTQYDELFGREYEQGPHYSIAQAITKYGKKVPTFRLYAAGIRWENSSDRDYENFGMSSFAASEVMTALLKREGIPFECNEGDRRFYIVILVDCGEKKLDVIQAFAKFSQRNLSEAAEDVDASLGTNLWGAESEAEAKTLRNMLEEVGATVALLNI